MSRVSKVLVANRGEIACRILRTLRRLGIPSVAVYHAQDADSLAVREADEAVELRGEPPVAAYLDIAQIVAACERTGADAVHPGFGFLSEKAAFAEALGAAGIAFIGPSPHAIRVMGDKIESKRLARACGVSTIPGGADEIEDAEHAVRVAHELGYPVIIKASAGGGGKGMRIACDDAQCRDGYVRASSEAQASFGDARVFIERYIERPRHIEIQVLADAHGHVVHLFERECSIQRRHQKVIEEAPSPFLDDATREAMGAQAVALARAVDYRSAGTVEFIVDSQRNFHFLEMNTRLQVEHPVTEMVTGLDIVAEQIRIARGEPLGYAQTDLAIRGHAIEARLYAEDADAGFLPATGQVHLLRLPRGEGLRIEHGLVQGQSISAAFDPMLAKLVAHGSDRAQAIARLAQGLRDTVLLGTVTNADFLARVLAHPAFAAGDTHTGFIGEHRAALAAAAPHEEQALALLAAAALAQRHVDPRFACPEPLAAIGEWRN
ncbi:MAG TPA: biotin carboxylase N-terminal domain-containing protein [Burkholderiaceae bacterium]|jgi:propionyl-CoA carboxylase alpha chain|nr:biotin carboxylase N-terminal domain-containing protein [Burkholderiaceae bacterium]